MSDLPKSVEEELQQAADMLQAQRDALAALGIDLRGHNASVFVKVGPARDAAVCLDCKADLMLALSTTVNPDRVGYQLLQHIGGQWQAAQPCPGRNFTEPEPDKGRW